MRSEEGDHRRKSSQVKIKNKRAIAVLIFLKKKKQC